MKKTYVAIFEEAEEGGYCVEFPDILGGFTCGDDFEDAKEMAKDLLRICLEEAPHQCFEPHSKEFFKKKLKKGQTLVEIEYEK